MERLEPIFFKLKESKSYRQTVGSISSSCITAATPLLGSSKQTACLVALEIVEVNTYSFLCNCLRVYIKIYLLNIYFVFRMEL